MSSQNEDTVQLVRVCARFPFSQTLASRNPPHPSSKSAGPRCPTKEVKLNKHAFDQGERIPLSQCPGPHPPRSEFTRQGCLCPVMNPDKNKSPKAQLPSKSSSSLTSQAGACGQS